MTNIILIGILWIIIGIWICYKRQWYYQANNNFGFCVLAVLLTPLNIIWTIIDIYCVSKWNNNI